VVRVASTRRRQQNAFQAKDRQTKKQTYRRTSLLREAHASRRGINPLECKGNYSATLNNIKLVHWPLIGGLLHLVQRGGTGRGRSPPRPILAVQNVTTHRSTASVPITVVMYNCPLLCGFNVPIKS